MDNNRRQILDMLAEGKIQVDGAERLLSLVSANDEPIESGMPGGTGRSSGKYPKESVEPGENADSDSPEQVNIHLSIALIRAGVKLAALIPSSSADSVNYELGKNGINSDIGNPKSPDLETLVESLQDLEVDVKDDRHKVRAFVE